MGSDEFRLISAGIDIGTTTTQLIISELLLKNRLPGARIPKIEIVQKNILYKSKIYITPIIDHHIVDAAAVRRIIKDEYSKAGFNPEEIDTGAIIITGETAKKENSERIIHELAGYAGDFVVAAAGPELESILAGKGAGAADISKEHLNTILNVDIGGGTTNIAVFNNGQIVDAICINVGGRLVEVESESKIVTYIAKPAKVFIDNYDIDIKIGKKADISSIENLCDQMVNLVCDIIEKKDIINALSEILMTSTLKKKYEYDGLMYSGGVAEYIYSEDFNIENGFIHNDIGPFLGKSFKNSRISKNYKLLIPRQTIRATVVGAGTQTVNISGSTVFIKKSLLPLRNIPVAKIYWSIYPNDYMEISENITESFKKYKEQSNINTVALDMPCPEELSFENIERMAKGIYDFWKKTMKKEDPLVVIVKKDIGKVLGQTLYTLSEGNMNFISIDSIDINDGDYIDIGKPMSTDDVVPVIIKTLLFSSK